MADTSRCRPDIAGPCLITRLASDCEQSPSQARRTNACVAGLRQVSATLPPAVRAAGGAKGGCQTGPKLFSGTPLSNTFTAGARKLGIWSAAATAFLGVAYFIPLVGGFLSLKSPEDPIGDPWFAILEILIIVMMPVMVALMGAVHAWALPGARAFSLLALVFMGIVAGLTCSLHFVLLTLGRDANFTAQRTASLFISFKWPSVVYALDILAWDFFFPLAVLSAAPVFGGSRLATRIRVLMITSGTLALAGLGGAIVGDMQLRNIGIIGYAVVFPVVALLLTRLFQRAPLLSG